MDLLFSQADYPVRFDWGFAGATATRADVAVVVDVLSFSTSVCVAVERGMRVYPYRWKGAEAQRFADEHDATLAFGRLEAERDDAPTDAPSLSPSALQTCRAVERLVMPSPNGSTIAAELLSQGSTVIAGCLRNARAVAEFAGHAVDAGRSVVVIAAGERWPHDGSLRPSVEDALGSGAILAALRAPGRAGELSPEAHAAASTFVGLSDQVQTVLTTCVSGRELAARNYEEDVAVAGAVDASSVLPLLRDGAFTKANETPDGQTPIS